MINIYKVSGNVFYIKNKNLLVFSKEKQIDPNDFTTQINEFVDYQFSYNYKNIMLTTKAMIILTEKCNFQCKYCYSKSFRHVEDLTFEKCKKVIDFLFSNALKLNKLFKRAPAVEIYFHGGGEPTLKLNLLQDIVTYSNDLSLKTKIKVNYKIATNGLLNDETLMFLQQNEFYCRVSLDVISHNNPKRVINSKRSFDLVAKVIDKMELMSIKYGIAITLCEDDLNEMNKTAIHVLNRWKTPLNVTFASMRETEASSLNNLSAPNKIKFHQELFKIISTYIEHKYSHYANFSSVEQYYLSNICAPCQSILGDIVVVHSDGNILGCSEFAKHFDAIYGHVDGNNLNIEIEKIKKNIDKFSTLYPKCNSCPISNYCYDSRAYCFYKNEISEEECGYLQNFYQTLFKKIVNDKLSLGNIDYSNNVKYYFLKVYNE